MKFYGLGVAFVSSLVVACSGLLVAAPGASAAPVVGTAEVVRRQNAIRSYFSDQVASLHAVATTRTSHGTTIDWVEPQAPLAPMPPPMIPCMQNCGQTELQEEPAAIGPSGTLPVVRFDVESYLRSVTIPPADPKEVLQSFHKGSGSAPPSPDSNGYYYSTWGQNGTFYGAGAALASWQSRPGVVSGGHSLSEIVISGGFPNQAIEVGQTEDITLNGGSAPYLFVYYTTNGHGVSGNNIGGYNRQVTGWQQVSQDAVPGVLMPATSTVGGTQYEIQLEIMRYYGNYWVWLNTEWIGYYPASLFNVGGNTIGLFTSASNAQFFGEIYDPLHPAAIAIGMGSGAFSSGGAGHAAYVRDAHYFTDGTSAMWIGFSPSSGTTVVTDSSCYNMSAILGDGSGCLYGSCNFNYFYYGGPGLGGNCR